MYWNCVPCIVLFILVVTGANAFSVRKGFNKLSKDSEKKNTFPIQTPLLKQSEFYQVFEKENFESRKDVEFDMHEEIR